MKKIVALLIMSTISCTVAEEDRLGNKPISGQIPSTDKTVLAGRTIGTSAETKTVSERADTEYTLLDRLYDTVWFQTAIDEDDGVVETETEFLFFKKIDNIVQLEEKEMENGVMEAPDKDNEYSALTEVKVVDLEKLNAFVAKNTEFENGAADDDEVEFEGYWLKDEKTLYVIDGDTDVEVTANLQAMMAMTATELAKKYDEDNKYILSETAEIVEVKPTTPPKPDPTPPVK